MGMPAACPPPPFTPPNNINGFVPAHEPVSAIRGGS